MKTIIHIFIGIVLIIMTNQCSQIKCDKTNKLIQTQNSDSINKKQRIVLDWKDSLIVKYINNSSSELIKIARQDTIPIEWMTQTEIRNGVKYVMVQIGHSFEHHFVANGWIYIDSLKKTIYEYDLANDTIIKWNK